MKNKSIPLIPQDAIALFIFAHGAGAGMEHSFMDTLAGYFYDQQIATLRFNFPHIDQGKKLPTSQTDSLKTLQEVYTEAVSEYNLPLFCGGKSYGGRMASLAAAKGIIPEVKGLVFIGFPLHSPNKPSTKRAEHFPEIQKPMLFLQGFKDKLAKPALLKEQLTPINSAKLVFFEGADHSFKVPATSPLPQKEVYYKIASDTKEWITGVINRNIL